MVLRDVQARTASSRGSISGEAGEKLASFLGSRDTESVARLAVRRSPMGILENRAKRVSNPGAAHIDLPLDEILDEIARRCARSAETTAHRYFSESPRRLLQSDALRVSWQANALIQRIIEPSRR